MKADLSNLGKWVDELKADIEDLDKKIDAIQPEPTPTPGGDYNLTCTTLISSATISAEQQTDLTPIPDLTGYDLIMVTIESVSYGIEAQAICPGVLFEASKQFCLQTPQLYMADPTGVANYSAFRFHWEQVNVEGTLVDYLHFDPMLLTTTGTRTIAVYGLKIEQAVTERDGLLKKAAKAVKKILGKEENK